MTQSPDDAGGQPAGHRPRGGQDDRSPAAVPPPGAWHFPPEPAPPYQPPPQQPPYQQAPYQEPAHQEPPHGAASPYGMPPWPGAPASYGTQYGAAYSPYQGIRGQDAGLAEWWRRLLARLIDVVAVSVVLVPLSIPLLSGPFSRVEQLTVQYPSLNAPAAQSALAQADGKLVVALWVFGLIAAAFWFGYDAVQHAKWGQTLGKRALSTRVVSALDGSPIGAGMAVRRAAVYALVPAIPVAGAVFALLNELWLLWDRRRQCLHDKAARTVVVRTGARAGGPAQGPAW